MTHMVLDIHFPAMLASNSPGDSAAIKATADATIQLVWATSAAAFMTLIAVGAAFVVPWLERQSRRKEERARQAAVDQRALGEMRRARELMDDVHLTLKTVTFISDETLWSFTNRINIIRRLIEKYLSAGEGTGELDRLEMQTVQSLYEVAEACRATQTKGDWHAEGDRHRAIATVERAQARAKEVFDYLDLHP